MKKNIKLYMMLALVMLLCLALPGFSALADESDITSLEATADETSVSVSGTTDEAVLAIMVEVVDSKGNTERSANYKEVRDYIRGVDDMIERKRKLFEIEP